MLQRFHRLLREYERLMKEQDEVRRTSHDAGQVITKLRNARKTLTIQRRTLALDTQLETLMDWEFRGHLHAASKEFGIAGDLLLDLERTLEHRSCARRKRVTLSKQQPLRVGVRHHCSAVAC
jgi:hypothetical protein